MVSFKNMSISKFLLLLFGIFFVLIVSSVVIQLTGANETAVFVAQVLFYVLLYYFFYSKGLTEREKKLMFMGSGKLTSVLLAITPLFAGRFFSMLYALLLENILPSAYKSYLKSSELIEQQMGSIGVFQMMLLFLAIVILAPIVEEIVFRGIFFNLLAKKRSTLFAMIVSSLVFGLLHAETMIPVTLIGFILCFIYHRTGNLLLAMAAHMFNNLAAFLMAFLLMDLPPESTLSITLGIMLIIASVVASLLLLKYIIKNWYFMKEGTPIHRNSAEGFISDEIQIRKKHTEVSIIDITTPLENQMLVFPGDPEVVVEKIRDVNIDGYELRKLSLSTHSGTHMDFPAHFISGGHTLDEIPIDRYYGEAVIVHSFDEPIPYGIKRVLAKEGYLSEDRARLLIEKGVLLIGTVHDSIEQDYPYPVHKLLLESDIIILENLQLSHVDTGIYKLAAFPLKISGAEAAPCRAVLFR